MGSQKVNDDLIKGRWVFQAAGMPCPGNHPMNRPRNPSAHFPTTRQRIIKLTVNHQDRHLELSETVGDFTILKRLENLYDRLPV